MSNTSQVEPVLETVPMTLELSKIIKAIGKQRTWQRILYRHCTRTGKPTIPQSAVIEKRGSNGYTSVSITWEQQCYLSGYYYDTRDARIDVYQKLVSAVIKEELAKLG